MAYFTKEFLDFFLELEENNNQEWFHSNKKRYETHVKKPMENFVTDVVVALQKLDSDIVVSPKKCIGRINRDIRFSNDKTPYKIRSFAHITKGDKMDPIPVIAFQMGARDLGLMSGFYNPPKERLKQIREKIQSDTGMFKKCYSDKNFVQTFGTIQGEANKRIPFEYKEMHKKEPLITNKQFYYVSELAPDVILTDDLLPLVIAYWKAAKPLNDFLS